MEFINELFEEHPKIKVLCNVLITLIGIALISVLFFVLSYKLRADLSRKQDVLNFFNGVSTDNISKTTLNELEKYKLTDISTDEYNVTPVIVDYISKVETAVNHIKNGYQGQTFQKTLNDDGADPNLAYSYLDEDITFLLEIIPMNQFDEFEMNSKSIIAYLTKELEKKFIHKSENFTKEWYINKDTILKDNTNKLVNSTTKEQYEIKLPFSCSFNILFPKVEKLDYKFTDVNLVDEKNRIRAILTTDSKENIETTIKFKDKGLLHDYDMTIDILGVLYKYNKGQVVVYSPYTVG